jgi:hypothetical protein
MQLIDAKQKIVIFDSNIYIKLKDDTNIRQRIYSNEKRLNIQSFASPWVVWELAQSRSDVALDFLKEHCKDESGQIRIIADPVAQIYYSIYGKESCLLKNQLDNVVVLIGLDSIKREQSNVKEILNKVSDSFINQFKTPLLSNEVLNDKKDAIKQRCAKDVVNMCIKINRNDSKVLNIDRFKVVKEFIQNNPVPLEYYCQLLKRKASQENVNKETLRHDQRDWAIVFYASQSNCYIITNENNLLSLDLTNVLSGEQYIQNILGGCLQ